MEMKRLILSGVISLGLIFTGCTSTDTGEKVENEGKEEVTQELTRDKFDSELIRVLLPITGYNIELQKSQYEGAVVSSERLAEYKKDYKKHLDKLEAIQNKYADIKDEKVKQSLEYLDLYIKNYKLKETYLLEAIEYDKKLTQEYYNISDEYYYFGDKLGDSLSFNESN